MEKIQIDPAKLHQLLEKLPPRNEFLPEGMQSVKEIATYYFQHLAPQSATRALRREMRQHPILQDALRLTGWEPSHRTLTPKQVRIIDFYLS